MRFHLAITWCTWCVVLLSACDAENPCDANETHVQGACIAKTAPPAVMDAGAVDEQDADLLDASALDADVCEDTLDASLGLECTTSDQCGCAAPYCAISPGNTVGVCAVQDCTPGGADCPDGYMCFDVSVFGAKGIPTFCVAK